MIARTTLLLTALVLTACSVERADTASTRTPGWQLKFGNGTVASYAEIDRAGTPTAIGVAWSANALEGLPTMPDQHRCYGRTKDGEIEAGTQCQHTIEHVIPLPDVVARRDDIPFKWVLLNWNPHGHIPPGVYDKPHFDVHFEMAPIAEVFAIEPGPCGPEFVRCDQFRISRKPLPPNYLAPGYVDVEAVVPVMGNHLIDTTGPEFQKQAFKSSWIYGVYDGKVIFYEVMLTHEHLLSKPQSCTPIKQAKAVALAGFYPTEYCIRHNARSGEFTVSMEKFAKREAAPPEPIAAGK